MQTNTITLTAADIEALREIQNMLGDWPTMRLLSSLGAERATANKVRARELVAAILGRIDAKATA